MKKLMSVLNGFMGCGIPGPPKKTAAGNLLPVAGNRIRHHTWPSSYWPLAAGHLLLIGEEGTISTLKALTELISGRRKGLSLTLPV